MMRWLLICVLLVTACDREVSKPAPQTVQPPVQVVQTPDQVVVAYYAAMSEARYDDAYAMVSEPDRAARSLEVFKAAASDRLQQAIAAKRSYEIQSTAVEGDKALVMVDSTGPDIASLQKFVLAKHLTKNPELPDAEGLKGLMRDALDMPEMPTIITHQKLFLSKAVSGAWMLDFDWDKEHAHRGVPVQERPKKPARDAGHD